MKNVMFLLIVSLFSVGCSIDASLQSGLGLSGIDANNGNPAITVRENHPALHGPGPSGATYSTVTSTLGDQYKVISSVGDATTMNMQTKSGYKVRLTVVGAAGSLIAQ